MLYIVPQQLRTSEAIILDLRGDLEGSHADNELLRQELCDVKMELEALKNSMKKFRSGKGKSATDTAGEPSSSKKPTREKITTGDPVLDDVAGTAGRKFLMLNEMFISRKWFLRKRPTDVAATDKDRYRLGDKHLLRCRLVELYKLFDSDYHKELAGSKLFRNVVCLSPLIVLRNTESPFLLVHG